MPSPGPACTLSRILWCCRLLMHHAGSTSQLAARVSLGLGRAGPWTSLMQSVGPSSTACSLDLGVLRPLHTHQVGCTLQLAPLMDACTSSMPSLGPPSTPQRLDSIM